MKRLAFLLVITTLSSPAFAVGIDSRSYTCTALTALITAQRYLFINNPRFEDTVVADASLCPGGYIIQLRSVPTTDQPECPVNYCIPGPGQGTN